MEDILLRKVFYPEDGATERWLDALQHGVDKDINRGVLIDIADDMTQTEFYNCVASGKYRIFPPHTAQIPKGNGEFRTVYVNEGIDRLFLTIVNNLLFELCPDMVHPACKSYLKGVGCGDVVVELSNYIGESKGTIGWKSDLRKYFDRVPLKYIEQCFDDVERRIGHSVVIDILREYYRSEAYFEGNSIELSYQYQSLKQGCAVAAFLADAILYPIDEQLSKYDGCYYRYSDDQVFVGKDYESALDDVRRMLGDMGMTINEKKLQYLDREHWFKFLGFSIKGKERSLSDSGIKKFQNDIELCTIKSGKKSLSSAIKAVVRKLYVGDGSHSWATRVLRVVNSKSDIDVLNTFCMDAIRAAVTGKHRIGGLGYRTEQKVGCISRGTGKNVTMNRKKIEALDGYHTIRCMQNALHSSRDAYEMLVRDML